MYKYFSRRIGTGNFRQSSEYSLTPLQGLIVLVFPSPPAAASWSVLSDTAGNCNVCSVAAADDCEAPAGLQRSSCRPVLTAAVRRAAPGSACVAPRAISVVLFQTVRC